MITPDKAANEPVFRDSGLSKTYPKKLLVHASVCSGVGMFELAAHWRGWVNAFTAEIDPYCVSVLKSRFPQTAHYGDFTNASIQRHLARRFAGKIDVLSAGLPCQPFSNAGKQIGLDDPRHLGPAFVRLVKRLRPRTVVVENVDRYAQVALDELSAGLEAQGYTCGSSVLPACGLGAPHRRYRLFMVAIWQPGKRIKATKNGSLHRIVSLSASPPAAAVLPRQLSLFGA